MATYFVSNNWWSQLDNYLSDSTEDNLVKVLDSSGHPELPFKISVNNEIMDVTSIDEIDPNLFTVSRGTENTVITEHIIGSLVENRLTSETLNNINEAIQRFELHLEAKVKYNSYAEFTEDNGNIIQIDYWADNTKATKLFTKAITYTNGNPTTITITDEISSAVMTTTIAYDGDDVVSVTKVVT